MNCTHCNTEMEREERSRGLPFSAERHSQDEMRRRENLQQRVVEAGRRAQEESRRADQAQQRAREMEGICVRMSIQLQTQGKVILDLLTLALPLFSQKLPQESIWRLCHRQDGVHVFEQAITHVQG